MRLLPILAILTAGIIISSTSGKRHHHQHHRRLLHHHFQHSKTRIDGGRSIFFRLISKEDATNKGSKEAGSKSKKHKGFTIKECTDCIELKRKSEQKSQDFTFRLKECVPCLEWQRRRLLTANEKKTTDGTNSEKGTNQKSKKDEANKSKNSKTKKKSEKITKKKSKKDKEEKSNQSNQKKTKKHKQPKSIQDNKKEKSPAAKSKRKKTKQSEKKKTAKSEKKETKKAKKKDTSTSSGSKEKKQKIHSKNKGTSKSSISKEKEENKQSKKKDTSKSSEGNENKEKKHLDPWKHCTKSRLHWISGHTCVYATQKRGTFKQGQEFCDSQGAKVLGSFAANFRTFASISKALSVGNGGPPRQYWLNGLMRFSWHSIPHFQMYWRDNKQAVPSAMMQDRYASWSLRVARYPRRCLAVFYQRGSGGNCILSG